MRINLDADWRLLRRHLRGYIVMTDLLRAILERPHDDMLRLVYADALEERGEAERSEFIRVQVTLALMHQDDDDGCDDCRKRDALRRRENELLNNANSSDEANIWKWIGPALELVTSPGGIEDNAPAYRSDDGGRVLFRRGFVASVSCRLEDWIGQWCWKCRDPDSAIFVGGKPVCPACNGIGRIGAHGIEIVKAQPVTEVLVTDVHPVFIMTTVGARWWWGDQRIPVDIINAANRSEERAVSGMSAVLIAWVRDKAGLTKLEVTK